MLANSSLLGFRVFKSSAKLRMFGKGFRLQSNDGKLWARSQENAAGPSWLDIAAPGTLEEALLYSDPNFICRVRVLDQMLASVSCGLWFWIKWLLQVCSHMRFRNRRCVSCPIKLMSPWCWSPWPGYINSTRQHSIRDYWMPSTVPS